jgi:signal transduction histidine kinase
VEVGLDGTGAEVVRLTISNAGTIPPDVLPHIFDPFRGGQRQPGRNDGLGLGLYIVQQIVLAHEGDIEVESGDTGRTLFRVKVPRRKG